MQRFFHPTVIKIGHQRHIRMGPLPFYVKALDSSGYVTLRRETAQAAVKRARELIEQKYREVEITDPDGRTYLPHEFDQL